MSTQQAVPAAARRTAAEEGRPFPRWTWPAGYAAAAIILFLCYLRISGTQAVTSDGASVALQAHDMLNGNWLLRGWSLTDVSFYTTELPEYMLVEVFRGLGPADVHTAAAITYTLLVVLASLLAKGSKRGREGLVRAVIAAGIMIAPQVGPGAFLLLLSPDHTGTGVPLLVIFLLLDRAPRSWWVPALAGLLLVWAQVGDKLVVTIGVVPILVVCVVRAYHGVVVRREPLVARAFDLQLAAAALISVLVADAATKVLSHLGGFQTQPLNTMFSASALWPFHLSLAAEGLLGLYGADVTNQKVGVVVALALVHLAGLALAAWATGRAFRRFFAMDDLIAQVLAVAIVVNIAAYVFSILPNTFWDDREIASVLPFGAVLAGRLLAAPLARVRLLPALAVIALCYVVALGYGVTRPQRGPHDQALASWLAGHHLTTGLGSYAEGNSVMLDSRGAVQLYAPLWRSNAVRPGLHETQAAEFSPHEHDADFVVTTHQDGPAFYIPPAWIIRAFGKPAHTYHYQSWTIMTWHKNLLTDLKLPRTRCAAGGFGETLGPRRAHSFPKTMAPRTTPGCEDTSWPSRRAIIPGARPAGPVMTETVPVAPGARSSPALARPVVRGAGGGYVGAVPLGPFGEAGQGDAQLAGHARRPVLDLGRNGGIDGPGEQAITLEVAQGQREHAAADALDQPF